VVGVSVLTGVLGTLAIIMLAGAVAAAVTVWVLYKRIRRSRALAGAVLRARSHLTWGPHANVLRLRVRLNDALDSGQAAVDLAVRSESTRGELPSIFRRIQREGISLDSQLRLMESEADSAVLARQMPAAIHRVDQVAGIVRRLRSAVATGLGDSTDDTLTMLRSDIDLEVAALQAGVQQLHALNTSDGLPEPRGRPSSDRLQRRNEV
jgi:hypothetical protein